MNIKIRDTFETEKAMMMNNAYCETLMDMAEKDPRIVALDSDLMSSSGMTPFYKKYPERFFNVGIQEANMIGVAAGLSATGKVPFAHSFGMFATRRACDQVFISAAYAKLNVRICGTDPGVTATYNGGTHMPFEDMAVLRGIPEVTLIEPTDTVMTENLLRQLDNVYGVYYLRMLRKNAVGIYAPGSTFEIGKGIVLCEGTDVTLVASGIEVYEALKAHEMLKNEGISARVVDMFTWKPIDGELLEECAAKTGAIVTCENHNSVAGLGSAVCEAICERRPVPVVRIGTGDQFGQVGMLDWLMDFYRLTDKHIVEAAKKAISLKSK